VFLVFLLALLTKLLPAINQLHRGGMRPNFVAADSCQQILECRLVKLTCQPALIFLGEDIIVASVHHFEFTLQAFAPDLNIDSAFVYFQVAANLTASGSGTSEIEPVTGRVSRTAGHDIHNIAAAQLIIQWHHARYQAISAMLGGDTSASTPVTDLRVDTIGE